MSKEKLARRKKMGDDPTAMSKSNTTEAGRIDPQPLPGSPQGKGNMMNNPQVGESFNQQVGSMSGMNLYPYGDGGIPITDGRMGAIGFQSNSGMPQNLVPGKRLNQQPYNSVPQPASGTQNMMDAMYMYNEAGQTAAKAYAARSNGSNEFLAPSYFVGPMGMMGRAAEVQAVQPMKGGIPANFETRVNTELPLQGSPSAEQTGMSTKRGGGRNKKS
nr:hypothetical protein 14 [bacterium]BDD46711.1 hypothetical protein 22 [Paracoccaceae bacterium]